MRKCICLKIIVALALASPAVCALPATSAVSAGAASTKISTSSAAVSAQKATSSVTAGAINTKNAVSTGASLAQTYSASTVYPTNVYCPKGMTCSFQAPTFIINAAS